MSVSVGKWWWKAVYFKVKGLSDSLMRWLKWMWDGVIRILGLRGRWWFDVNLHVLAQRAGVGIGLGTAHCLAVVGFGCRVNLWMLLPVAAVGKSSLTKLTLEWLLTCNTNIIFTVRAHLKHNKKGPDKWLCYFFLLMWQRTESSKTLAVVQDPILKIFHELLLLSCVYCVLCVGASQIKHIFISGHQFRCPTVGWWRNCLYLIFILPSAYLERWLKCFSS